MVVMDLDMVVLVILVLATMARGPLMLSQRLMLDLDIPVLDMLDMVVMVLVMAVSAILVLVTMARGPLMLSQRLKLMLVFSMESMDMVLVWDMLDLDIPVLDMPDMVVMDSDMEDTVLDMDVPSMVKQVIYASKSSK